nr:MAG TPA: hypothetical protein [Caudoviricetes sp.]
MLILTHLFFKKIFLTRVQQTSTSGCLNSQPLFSRLPPVDVN